MLEIAFETQLDIIIVAQSYIYFEKLILHVNLKFLQSLSNFQFLKNEKLVILYLKIRV